MNSIRTLMSRAAATAIAGALAFPAAAQTAGTDDADAIIVTALKREQNLQDVPISLEVVSGKKLDDFRANDFKQVMNYVPNVFVQSTAGNDTIYIRGFGSPPANFSFDQSVSLYVDGVYAGRNRQAQAPFFDLERVEVLRGPQGALFGKNTAAGAVSIVSAGPTREFEGEANALYNFDQKGFDVSGFVSGPIGDNFGVRLAGKIINQDGYIRNLANDNKEPKTEQQVFRLTAKWDASETLDITGKLEYANRDTVGGITVSSPLTTGQQPRHTRYADQNPLGGEGTSTKSVMGSLTANLSLGEYTLTSITGYSWFRGDIVNNFDQTIPTGGVTANSVYNKFVEDFNQVSQEIRLLSPTGRTLEFIVGAYFDSANYKLTQYGGFDIAALNYFGLLRTNFDQNSKTASVFGQATLNATDALRVIGSLRYTRTKKDAFFDGELVYGPFALRPITTASGDLSEGLTDPSVTVQYDITDRVMVYGTFGKGSKSGGFVSNTYGTLDNTFQFAPERSRNYELGLKSAFADGAVVFNAAVYDTKFTNLQVSVYNPTTSSYLTSNAASATSRGIEASLTVNPIDNFDITASGAYQDLEYDDYPGAACLATQPLTECNPAVPASIAANNLAGYSPALYSKFSGNIQAHARFDLPSDMKLDVTGIVGGRSKYFNSDNQSPTFGVQKGYAKVDARIQVAPQDDRWHVAVIGKNLTNKLTTGSSFNLPSPITAAPRAILYVEPARSISVEAGVRF
ncbi:TonB-dependent receptor [Sphingosinicella soli]|uniref:Iron complex outermembrane receptor protein n=1 Tax=Sphingosinicella soli TaxID=333708 RepID=A0A7W7F6P4_9SPHN|nr:TonB-dependent receptor [Sphingosinicella soli]MBB4632750.1 iron complex outermembrane receptor protein [Sphingosinicella soli]